MKGNIGNMMKQAQQMQANMQRAQAEIATLEVTGESGGGMAKVTMTGKHEVRRVSLDPSIVSSDDKDMLEDLVAAAINDAVQKVERVTQEKMAERDGRHAAAARHEDAVLMIYPPSLVRLIEALRCLPGVGPKSAQRMAFHLLEKDRNGAGLLSDALQKAVEGVGRCKRCRMFAEGELCPICSTASRDQSLLCVVESPADVAAIEQSGSYRGTYFVLMGHLSPLDGIGPDELGFAQLEALLDEGVVKEAILATNPTVEGEATAHVIAELAQRHKIKSSRIAHGVPVGGELEYVDGGTLAHALAGRHVLSG